MDESIHNEATHSINDLQLFGYIQRFDFLRKKTLSKTFWKLPNGDTVIFYHSPSDSWPGDHAKNIELIEKNGTTYSFQFGASHSGYNKVELRISSDGAVICLLDLRDGQIGAALNLDTKSFQEEAIPPKYYKHGIELFGVKMDDSRVLTPEL